MKSMASEFARRGNPMLTEREQKEMRARLLPARGGARKAKPKGTWVDVIPLKSDRPKNPAQEVLEMTMRALDLHPRRFQEIPDPGPRPLRFEKRPDLEAIAENKARSVEIARLKVLQERADAEAEMIRMFRGLELTMAFALSGDFTD